MSKKLRVLALVLAVLSIISLVSCDDASGVTAPIYLLRALGDGGGVVRCEIEVPSGADPGEAAMKALIDPPENLDGASPFADGVELVSVSYYGGIATVALSREYLDMDGLALAEAEGCAALTMLAVERVSSVRIVVDGEPHPRGEQGFFTAASVISEDVGTQSLERELLLYFYNPKTGVLEAERRGIVLREGEPVERYVLEELIKGPGDSGLEAVLPNDAGVRAIESVGTACIVDFSENFDEVFLGERDEENRALASIVGSLAASGGVETVFISCDGVQLYRGAALGECDAYTDPWGYAAFEVWLPSNDSEHVEPIDAMISVAGAYSLDRMLVEYFIGGLDGAGFDSALPPDTRVLRMNCSSSHCTIDFSAELLEGDMDEAEVGLALTALAETLAANGYASFGVEVSVAGEPYTFVSATGERIHPDFQSK